MSDDLCRISTDDVTLDMLGAGYQPNADDEAVVRGLAAVRDQARAADAYDFFISQERASLTRDTGRTARVRLILMALFAVAGLGFSTSVILAIWTTPAYGWPLLVSVISNAILVSAVALGMFAK